MTDSPEPFDRRSFLKMGGAAGLLPLSSVITGKVSAQPSAGERGVQRYAMLGSTDIRMSDISFGSSRLRRGEEGLVSHALDLGVNYFDTADSYTRGQSETVLGNALQGVRDKVYLASKARIDSNDNQRTIMRALEDSLKRLQTDYVDVYFNHAVNDIDRLNNPEWYEFVVRAKQQGKIRFTGMSGHAGNLSSCLDHAIAHNLIDVMLVAYNFGQDPAFYESLTRSFDRIATHPGLPGVLERAKQNGIGVIAMKTLMGARLNDMRPYESAGTTFSQAAFRWTLSNPDVDALVVSMTDSAEIEEYLGASGAVRTSSIDIDLLQRYARLNSTTYCRAACNDCEGACPFGVPIADVLRTRMYATDYQDVGFARLEYAELASNASACLGCSGEPCQNACTHGLQIPDLCAPTHRMLS